jgi:hypothetical protein
MTRVVRLINSDVLAQGTTKVNGIQQLFVKTKVRIETNETTASFSRPHIRAFT